MSNLTSQDIKLIQDSYQAIKLQKGYLADVFYRTLFRNAPQARDLFDSEMSAQMDKFNDMLDFLVNNLATPWIFTGKVKRLARRHVTYGAVPEHYEIVGESLVQAIEEMAPQQLTDAELNAWTKAYRGIANMMIDAAYDNAA